MKKSNWITFLINGIIAVIFSIIALIIPDKVLVIAQYFGLLIMIAGIILLVVSVKNIRNDQPYILLLTEAISAIIIGGIILFYTRQSLSIL